MRKRRRKEDEEEEVEDGNWCPKHVRLLRSLHGSRLRALLDLLREKLGLRGDEIVHDGDSVEYLTLLNHSFAVLSEGAPDRVPELTSQRWSQQQVVERSVQLHLREGASSNVLCFGYGQVQSTGSNKEISALKGPEYHHLNVATGFISTHLWVTLLARVGEERMLYLLSYASIFVPLPNFCLLQVAGRPFSTAAPKSRQLIASGRRSQCELPMEVQSDTPRIEQISTKKNVEQCEEVTEGVTRSRKRTRPSSWVRRKQRAVQGAQRRVDVTEPVISSLPTVSEVELPMPVNRVGHAPRLIDRSTIFYHSTFSSHASLPANHILNTSNVNDADISRLHGSMFKPLDTTSGEASTSTAKEESTENLKGILMKMVRNAKKCNYARLLSRHCPLPTYLPAPLPEVKTSKRKATKRLSFSKDMYATQEKIEVDSWPASEFKKSCSRKQETYEPEFPAVDVNVKGSSKTRSSTPLKLEHAETKLVVDERGKDARGPTGDLAKLVTLTTSHSQVVNFLWAVCRSLLPEEFLGSQRFRRSLCSGIASFVSLRRYEAFYVQQLFNKLHASITAWPDIGKRRKEPGWDLLHDWLYWLFTQIIVPLLRNHFYITEAENHRQNVLYYRKPIWARIHMLSLNTLVGKYYKKLSLSSVAAVLQNRSLGFSRIRLLPKYNGVRPIANLSSRTRCTLPLKRRRVDHEGHIRRFAFKSINSRLKGVHTCLKYEQENHSEDMGASVFGYKDAYIKFLPYVMQLKSLPGGLPPMYMAVCDISKAYDTIKQDKLCEVLSSFIRLPVYHIRRYVSLFNTMGCARASYKQTCSTSDRDCDIFNLFMDLSGRRSHSILQDQGVVTRLKQGHILRLIEEHVKRNIVKIGPHFYLQKAGIAQGSVLSPLLCSVFFGHLDEHTLMPLLQQNHQEGNNNGVTILLRLIDDSLLISTSRSCVARFVKLMHDGFEEYGCHANQQKTAVSFDLLLNKKKQGKSKHGVYMTSDGANFMRWSGLLINCCTLEVQADYTRYIGDSIRGSITVLRKTNPGAQVPIKLCHFVRAKCHPMLYDLRINSPSTTRLNAYQAFLLCAMKFHAYLCSMERTCQHHSPFLLQAIEFTPSYMHGLLKKQMQEMGDGMHLGVRKEEMTWLALHAFLKVLNKKQSRYAELLFLIQEKLNLPHYRGFSQCPHLASARDESRSTMFKYILY